MFPSRLAGLNVLMVERDTPQGEGEPLLAQILGATLDSGAEDGFGEPLESGFSSTEHRWDFILHARHVEAARDFFLQGEGILRVAFLMGETHGRFFALFKELKVDRKNRTVLTLLLLLLEQEDDVEIF